MAGIVNKVYWNTVAWDQAPQMMSDCQASRAVFHPLLIFFALFPHCGAISLTRYTVVL